MKLYDENRQELKDAYSITEEETILIYFSTDEDDDIFAEIYVSDDEVIILDFNGNNNQLNYIKAYSEIAKQSIIDFKNY